MKEVSSQNRSPPEAVPSRWWADEMLGRLARYLRMVGLDTAYRSGLSDEEVERRARTEGRLLLTRDRALARHSTGSILLTQVSIRDQWRELAARFPALPIEPRFERCTLCNGRLAPATDARPAVTRDPPPPTLPEARRVYCCLECGHPYWDGSHMTSLRRRLAAWSDRGSP
jgi:uncharacterized protein with PIN domain